MRFLLIFSLFLSSFSYGYSRSADSLFSDFKNDIRIELKRSNRISWDNETKKSYYKLMVDCPIELLPKYLDDSIPAIRCMIFRGLANKNVDTNLLKKIIDRHRDDTALFTSSSTDVVITQTVVDYMEFILKIRLNKKTPYLEVDYKSLLQALQDKEKETVRLVLPGEYHGVITKDALLSIESIKCSIEDYKLISLSLSNAQHTITTTNILNSKIKDFIKKMASGDVLYLEDIIVECPDKSKRTLSSRILTLE